jgi:hypothetical protein
MIANESEYYMTEAQRLRAQAERCLELAHKTTDENLADTLTGLAANSLERATDLERRAPSK